MSSYSEGDDGVTTSISSLCCLSIVSNVGAMRDGRLVGENSWRSRAGSGGSILVTIWLESRGNGDIPEAVELRR